MVCHIGGFWRYMMGCMYSGGKETSHGGSWIMAFIFFCYCEWVKDMHPHLSSVIDQFLLERFITIVVYGDDHIWCAPAFLRGVMNHKTWKQFLEDYFQMQLRDENIYDSLLSIPDDTGRFKLRGPKFLKVYFIRNEDSNPLLAPILPYKEIDEQICKALTWDYDTPGENIPVVIGFAWDTRATNRYAYDVVLDLYRELMALDPRSPEEMLRSIDIEDMSGTKMRRLIRKVGVPRSEFFNFPSYSDMRKRHVLDPVKANYRMTFSEATGNFDPYDYEEMDGEGFDW